MIFHILGDMSENVQKRLGSCGMAAWLRAGNGAHQRQRNRKEGVIGVKKRLLNFIFRSLYVEKNYLYQFIGAVNRVKAAGVDSMFSMVLPFPITIICKVPKVFGE